MHFRRFWDPHGLPTFPGRRQTANTRSQSGPPNPQKRLRGAHISTLRRFQAPSCKVFEQTTYTNTSNIDFCRTYHAFSKVLGTPRAPHFSWSTNTRSHPAPPNPQKRLRGAHILTLRRFQAPSCKHFRQTTYTNTSNIDFCRTYNAFAEVLGPPRAPHFSRSTLFRRQTAHPRSHPAPPNL